MNQSTKTLLIFFTTIAITMLVIKQFNKPEVKVENFDQYVDFPESTKYIHHTKPVKCILEKVQVQEVAEESQLLQGSNYLKTWEVNLLNLKNQVRKAYLITSSEDPWLQGQEYFLSTNCQEIEDDEVTALKKQVEDGCTSLYYWDKENYQISRQCGYVVNDQPLFLHFKAAKQQ